MARPLEQNPLSSTERSRQRRERLRLVEPPKPQATDEERKRRDAEQKQAKRDLELWSKIESGIRTKSSLTGRQKERFNEYRRQQRRERMADAAELEADFSSHDWQLHHGDFQSWNIKPGSAKLILTDPPYSAEHLDLYHDLAERADEWLDEEGWLAVMCGQRHLPKMLTALADGPLEYVWMCNLAHSAGRVNGIQFLKIQNSWKPLVLLRKGRPVLSEWTNDRFDYDWKPDDGDYHRWQQDVSPFQKLIRVLTDIGDVVIDPMCGSGTTGVAALSIKRSFLGCDISLEAVHAAHHRLKLAAVAAP